MKILINTLGSLGDLYPFLALGQVLRARGHHVAIATHSVHGTAIEQAGFHFIDASGMPQPDDVSAFTERVFHPLHGPRLLIRDFAAADVRESYARLKAACKDADVLITSTLAFAGHILGETLSAEGRLSWVSVLLAPASFLSIYDPPVTGMGWIDALTRGPLRGKPLLRSLTALRIRGWTAPVRAFRRELGLTAVSPLGDPFQRGQHSPDCALALFSPLLAERQPDWPAQVRVTGFAHYAQPNTIIEPELDAFLRSGTPPLVFSLGSTAVHIGATFLRESLKLSEQLGRRAVLFTGSPLNRAQLPPHLPATVHAVDYARHADVFSHAAAIVHHGGVGTSTEALRAGRPMLVVPHGFDQFDNANRLKRLGVAQTVAARDYSAQTARPLLDGLLHHSRYTQRAQHCGEIVRAERGDVVAADLIEASVRERH